MNKLKTIEEVRADFTRRGVNIKQWAKKHGLRASSVYNVLNEKTIGTRGMAHKVAVLLGVKDGLIDDNDQEAL